MNSIGQQIISEIIKQTMFVVNHPDPETAHVFVWSSGAAEQLDALVDRKLKDVTRTMHEAQDMLSAALDAGHPTSLHVTAHAVRDNLRTQLAIFGRPEPRQQCKRCKGIGYICFKEPCPDCSG